MAKTLLVLAVALVALSSLACGDALLSAPSSTPIVNASPVLSSSPRNPNACKNLGYVVLCP